MTLIVKDKFNIKGRGDVYTLSLKENNLNLTRETIKEFLGTTVTINEKEYKVRGVEAWGIMELNDNIGLLV